MPTNHHGSRPTKDAGPIDNDEAMTPPSVPAVSSPRCGVRSLGSSLVCDREPHTDGLHECGPFAFSNDFYTPTTDETAAAVASTLSPAPATSETSAAPDPDKLWSLQSGDGAAPPPAKPKRKAKTATTLDLDAWGRCCQAWDTIRGKPGAWKPEAGMGRQIAEGIGRVGAARMEARLASVAAGTSPAGRKIRAFFDAEGADLGMLCWERGAKLLTALDGEIEQATLDAESRSGEPQAVGGVVGRSESQNAREGQPAPRQTVSWPDVLRDLGSDPDHHPEDGPHRTAWQSVRQAVLVSTKKAGDPWKQWCDADDRTRQHVEGLLNRGLVK